MHESCEVGYKHLGTLIIYVDVPTYQLIIINTYGVKNLTISGADLSTYHLKHVILL